MIESFITAFIIYFVVIDPIGNAPIFLAVTGAQDRARKMRTALEGTLVATMIMLFFAVCGAWILAYLNISEAAFKIAGGIILFLVALDMLAAKRQARKRAQSTGDAATDEVDSDNLAIYPLAIPLLARPSAIMPACDYVGNRRQCRFCRQHCWHDDRLCRIDRCHCDNRYHPVHDRSRRGLAE